MKQALRMSSAAVALAVFVAVPSHAQDQATNAASPPPPTLAAPPTEGAVGPAQLRDFSINGTVTRRADPAPTAARPAPNTAPAEAAASRAQPTTQPATATRNERPSVATAQRSGAAPATPTVGQSSDFNFTPSAQPTQPASFPQQTIDPNAPVPIVDTGTHGSVLSYWPWVLALLAAVGAALWYFRRQRPGGYAFAGAGADTSAFDFSPPAAPPRAAPKPLPAPPKPAPAPTPPVAPQGIISTRLRPWLEIEFQPQAAIIDAEKGSIQFEVVIFNSGSAPARDVLVEAAMFNAGTDQDQVLGAFFQRPNAEGEGTTIPPLQRMNFRSIVSMPRDQLRIFEVEKRPLFVPLVGFNARYRWSSGTGQTSASFIVGRNGSGEKMAPFLIEKDAKTYRGLETREHTLGVRQ